MHIPTSPSGQAGDAAAPLPTVVHLSIRPVPPTGIKDAPKKKNIRRATVEEGEDVVPPGCCSGCTIC